MEADEEAPALLPPRQRREMERRRVLSAGALLCVLLVTMDRGENDALIMERRARTRADELAKQKVSRDLNTLSRLGLNGTINVLESRRESFERAAHGGRLLNVTGVYRGKTDVLQLEMVPAEAPHTKTISLVTGMLMREQRTSGVVGVYAVDRLFLLVVPKEQTFAIALRRRERPESDDGRVRRHDGTARHNGTAMNSGTNGSRVRMRRQNASDGHWRPQPRRLEEQRGTVLAVLNLTNATYEVLAVAGGVITASREDEVFQLSPLKLPLKKPPGTPDTVEENTTECMTLLELSLRESTTEPGLAASVQGTGRGCGEPKFTLKGKALRVNWEAARRSGTAYLMLATTSALAQLGLIWRQLRFSREQAVGRRVSVICIGALTLLDALECALNLSLSAALPQLFGVFGSVAFLKLVIFCVVEMRYMLFLVESHSPERFWRDGFSATREALARLQTRFYAALFVTLGLIYVAKRRHDRLFGLLIALYSFWLPQIARNAIEDCREPAFDQHFVAGTALARMVVPLYCALWPWSLPRTMLSTYDVTPKTGLFCLGLVAWQGVQIVTLKLQRTRGPRFFVPKRFLPVRYDYERVPANKDPNLECAICYQNLPLTTGEHLVTPCDHAFHKECLSQWMALKMDCPTCRQTLPPR